MKKVTLVTTLFLLSAAGTLVLSAKAPTVTPTTIISVGSDAPAPLCDPTEQDCKIVKAR